MAYLTKAAFGFYFDRFTLGNARTEYARDNGLVRKVMLEKFWTQKIESKIVREALKIRYYGEDISTFL